MIADKEKTLMTTNRSRVRPSSLPVLLEAKLERKQAEESLQALLNRVQLLKVEEEKAVTKIKETKRRGKEIVSIKKRNEDAYLRRLSLQERNQEMMEEALKRATLSRESLKSRIQQSKAIAYEQRRATVLATKEEEEKLLDTLHMNKINDIYERKVKADEERIRRDLLKAKLENDRIRREELAQNEFRKKVDAERKRKEEASEMLQKLEDEEKAIIERLKKTQQLQQQAYEFLLRVEKS